MELRYAYGPSSFIHNDLYYNYEVEGEDYTREATKLLRDNRYNLTSKVDYEWLGTITYISPDRVIMRKGRSYTIWDVEITSDLTNKLDNYIKKFIVEMSYGKFGDEIEQIPIKEVDPQDIYDDPYFITYSLQSSNLEVYNVTNDPSF